MNVREMKLSIACGEENAKIRSLNTWFDVLFKNLIPHDLTPYIQNIMYYKSDLVFMDNMKCIMSFDTKNKCLYCIYHGFWEVLEYDYNCKYEEIQEIILYKVEEFFNIELSTYPIISTMWLMNLEDIYNKVVVK